jgi:hypothetical protein
MRKKISHLLLFIILINFNTFSQKLISKLVAKTANATSVELPTTSKLSDLQPIVGIYSNLSPTELDLVSQSFFPSWKSGGQMIYITFHNATSPQAYKIDGTVTIDGKIAELSTNGTYYTITETTDSPKKIEVLTSSGEKSSFVLEPSKKQFNIKSINGLSQEITLDLSKDVEIELEDTKIPESNLLKISIAISQLGIKSTYDVCYIKKGSKIVVPAAAFRNINISRNGKYKKSYLALGVDDYVPVSSLEGNIKKIFYISNYSDGKMVSIKVEPKLNLGLTLKGKEGQMEYEILKPNAFTSRPFNHLKKLAITSFSISGITYVDHSVIVQDKNLEKDLAQTTKTTKITFPKQSDATWDAVLVKMLPELTKSLQTDLQASVVPIDELAKQTSYNKLISFSSNLNTEKEFIKGIGNTKRLNELAFVEAFGVACIQEQLMKETSSDALCKVNLELILSSEKEKAYLTPKFTYEIIGKINGFAANTKYVTGTITGSPIESDLIGLSIEYSTSGSGKPFIKDNVKTYSTAASSISAEQLEKLLRTSDIMTTFSKTLKQIIESEKLYGDYEIVWNLRN